MLGTTLLLTTTGAMAQLEIHVDPQGSELPDGSPANPYQSLPAAICFAGPNDTVVLHPGRYERRAKPGEPLILGQPARLRAVGGVATIGELAASPTIVLDIVTYNTHLFGDEALDFLPEFADRTRASLIAQALLDEDADIVALQEVWDEELAAIILDTSRPTYPHQFYCNVHDECGDLLNSGLLVLSKHKILKRGTCCACDESACLTEEDCSCNSDATKVVFFEAEECCAPLVANCCIRGCVECDGFASKGFVQATIALPDGFQIGFFVTHTQAWNTGLGAAIRFQQARERRAAVDKYRSSNPGTEVIVVGDFNVIGGTDEYFESLLPAMGFRDAARTAPCFDPGFVTYDPFNELVQIFDPEAQPELLDYVFYSHGTDFDVIPILLADRRYQAPSPIVVDDETASDLSDHYAIRTRFRFFR